MFNIAFFGILICLLINFISSADVGNWTFGQNGQYWCIHMVGDINLILEYQTTNGSISKTNFTVPSDAIVGNASTCNYNFANGTVLNNEQILSLNFFDNNKWELTFTFTDKSKSGDYVDVYQVSLKYILDQEHFPDAAYQGETITVKNTNGTVANLALFSTLKDRSYKCHSVVDTEIVKNNFTLRTSDLQVEAFMANTTNFLRANVCTKDLQDGKSDLIPIIIGAALAALVVIVLIAYLIGRARTKRTVYETI